MSNAYGALGDTQKDLECQQKCLEITRQTGKSQPLRSQHYFIVGFPVFTGDVRGEGNAHCNISCAYENMGDLTSAVNHMQLAKGRYISCFGAEHSEVIDAQEQVERLQTQQ